MALRPLLLRTVRTPRGRSAYVGVAGAGSPAEGESQPARFGTTALPPGTFSPTHDGPEPYAKTWGPPVKYVRIPPGEAGTVATLKIMKGLVLGKGGSRNPEVILLAKKIVSDVSPGPTKDYRAMAQAILDFMKTEVKYELDPAGLEYVQSPHYTLLNSGSGDCDDHSTATAALAMALGFRAGFRTVKGDPGRPEQWSHVYPVIGIQGPRGEAEWLTADSTQRESYLGWNPPGAKLYGMKTWVIEPRLAEGDEWDS